MSAPRSRVIPLGAGRPTIEVLDAGDGAPLLFLHGAGGIPAWDGALPLLAREYHVWAPLLPGFGRSTGLEHLEDQLDVVLHCFDVLEAPILRVTGYDTPYPPATIEAHYLPNAERILAAVDRVINY